MKKYLSIFNYQTLFVTALSLLSCYLSLRFQLTVYADFLIIGIVILFPITFTMREAFRRRERSIEYLSLLKSSLQSVFYSLQNTKLEEEDKAEFARIAHHLSQTLQEYLLGLSKDTVAVDQAFLAVITFIHENKKELKKISPRILLFISKINESIQYLLAVKRHRTPWGPRVIVLFAIYGFCIFYPPSILYEGISDLQIWNLFLMTGFKVLILISLYNVQVLMEDPFNENTPDGIRLNDFRFAGETVPPTALNTTEGESLPPTALNTTGGESLPPTALNTPEGKSLPPTALNTTVTET